MADAAVVVNAVCMLASADPLKNFVFNLLQFNISLPNRSKRLNPTLHTPITFPPLPHSPFPTLFCSQLVILGSHCAGPGADDSYADLRSDYQKNEVALDYNAGFTGQLSGAAAVGK